MRYPLIAGIIIFLFVAAAPAAADAILSAKESDLLAKLTQKVLGPVPEDSSDHVAKVTRGEGPRAPGCTVVKTVQSDGKTFRRWRCPVGTFEKKGW